MTQRFSPTRLAITIASGLALTFSGLGPAQATATGPIAEVVEPSSDVSAAKPSKKGPKKPPVAVEVPGFHGLLIPHGAKFRGPAPGGRGQIISVRYEKGRASVESSLRALLKAEKWTVKADTLSPRGTARITVERKGHTIKISVTGTVTQAALILSRIEPAKTPAPKKK